MVVPLTLFRAIYLRATVSLLVPIAILVHRASRNLAGTITQAVNALSRRERRFNAPGWRSLPISGRHPVSFQICRPGRLRCACWKGSGNRVRQFCSTHVCALDNKRLDPDVCVSQGDEERRVRFECRGKTPPLLPLSRTNRSRLYHPALRPFSGPWGLQSSDCNSYCI